MATETETEDFSEIKKATDGLGHLASPYYLGELGWTDEEICEAVAAGALRWVSNGDLRTSTACL